MSTSEEFDTVTSLGKYNAQSVIKALGIPEDDYIAHQSVRFVFRQLYEEFRPISQNALQANEMTADKTFQKIKHRYDLARLYENYFFPSDHCYDRDPFMVALICDGFVTNINEPIQDPSDSEESIMRDDGFDNDVACVANIIWEGANELAGKGIPEDDKFSFESAFLAHINILEDLMDIESSFNEFEPKKLSDILNNDIVVWRNFIFTWTAIGAYLKGYIENIETALHTKLTPPRTKGAHLSLVPPPTP